METESMENNPINGVSTSETLQATISENATQASSSQLDDKEKESDFSLIQNNLDKVVDEDTDNSALIQEESNPPAQDDNKQCDKEDDRTQDDEKDCVEKINSISDKLEQVDSHITSLQKAVGDNHTLHIDEFRHELASLDSRIVSLQKTIVESHRVTTDNMHRELEKYRHGLLRKMEQELFEELIELYDIVDNAIATANNDPASALSHLKGLRDQIDASLYNHGIEKRVANNGESFNPGRHHYVGPDVPTGDKSLDGHIANMAKSGFDDTDEMYSSLTDSCKKLRKIWVQRYRYDSSLDNSRNLEEETTLQDDNADTK